MYAHCVAAYLGDVLIRERNLVAAVAGTDKILKILRALQAGLLADLCHCRYCGCLGIDLALYRGICYHLAVLIEYYCLCVGRAYVTTAKIFHY